MDSGPFDGGQKTAASGQLQATLRLHIPTVVPWFCYGVVTVVHYGAHQIFTRLAYDHIGDAIGGFVVEGVTALNILTYLGFLYFTLRWTRSSAARGSTTPH